MASSREEKDRQVWIFPPPLSFHPKDRETEKRERRRKVVVAGKWKLRQKRQASPSLIAPRSERIGKNSIQLSPSKKFLWAPKVANKMRA